MPVKDARWQHAASSWPRWMWTRTRSQKIAAETGGKFYRATDTDSLKNIYAEIDRLEKTTHTVKKFETPHGAVRLGGHSRARRCSAPASASNKPASAGCHEPATQLSPSYHMKFAEPLWLLAGARRVRRARLAVSPVRSRAARRARHSSPPRACSHKLTASFSAPRRRLKRGLFIAGVGLSLRRARAAAGRLSLGGDAAQGIEVLFAVDTSKSMLTQDVKPDRLTRAKLAVNDFVDKLDGDGVGLIAFAGNAFLQCPITLDYDAFHESLDALDTTIDSARRHGHRRAIREVRGAFQDAHGDGQNPRPAHRRRGPRRQRHQRRASGGEGRREDLHRRRRQHDRRTDSGAERERRTDFVKDETGQFVKSHLDEATLKKIAEATGGMYEPLGAQGEGLDDDLRARGSRSSPATISARARRRCRWRNSTGRCSPRWPASWANCSSATAAGVRAPKRRAGAGEEAARARAASRGRRARAVRRCHQRTCLTPQSRGEGLPERRLRDGAAGVCRDRREAARERRSAIQRRHRCLQSRRVREGRDRLSNKASKTDAGAGAAGRVLQPRQHAVPHRPEDREEQPAGDHQDLGASGEVL